jgi:hypothetical protein
MSLSFQISGHKPRHAGSGPLILTALFRKEKLKILMADIDLLDKDSKRERSILRQACLLCYFELSVDPFGPPRNHMKTAGFFLLLAGWVLVLAAIALLPAAGTRAAFLFAGIAVEILGLVLFARAHLTAGKEA